MQAHQPAGEPGPSSDWELFEAIYPKLRRFAAVVADLDIDPDDLVHDAVAAVLARRSLGDLDQPLGYLKKAIVNGSANHRRRQSVFRKYAPRLLTADHDFEQYPSDLAILDVLEPMDRAVIFLADVEGLPHAVIAEELGLSAGAVRKRVSRSRRKLAAALEAHDVDDTNETVWPGVGMEGANR